MKKIIYAILTLFYKPEKLAKLFADKAGKALLDLKDTGYLNDIGWINSINTGTIVDKTGEPLPWVTYPFIDFIGERLNKKLDIFEFGSGNSTLYYATRTASVTSVEHEKFWYDKIKSSMPQNVQLHFCELVEGGDYCKYAGTTNKSYDIIIVDGRDRVNCSINNLDALKPGGVLVLDDSEREHYLPGINFLTGKGFKRLDFWGMAPTVNYLKCTSIFYKDGNCLGI